MSLTMEFSTRNSEGDTSCDRTHWQTCSSERHEDHVQHVTHTPSTCRTSPFLYTLQSSGLCSIFFKSVILAILVTSIVVGVESKPQGSYQEEQDWYRDRETMMVVSSHFRSLSSSTSVYIVLFIT